MADKLLYNPNDYTQNYSLFELQFVVKTFGHSTQWTNQFQYLMKVPKVVEPMNKKVLCKALGTIMINSKCPHQPTVSKLFHQ